MNRNLLNKRINGQTKKWGIGLNINDFVTEFETSRFFSLIVRTCGGALIEKQFTTTVTHEHAFLEEFVKEDVT